VTKKKENKEVRATEPRKTKDAKQRKSSQVLTLRETPVIYQKILISHVNDLLVPIVIERENNIQSLLEHFLFQLYFSE